jgi:erythromycin esterase-like protein
LIGEQSHGTEEHYKVRGPKKSFSFFLTFCVFKKNRCDLAKQIVTTTLKKCFVVLEAAHCDGQRINEYVTGASKELVFADNEFPAWIWNNVVSRNFFDWCREHNRDNVHVEVVGMDVYKPNLNTPLPEDVPFDNRDRYLSALAARSFRDYRAQNNSWNVRGNNTGGCDLFFIFLHLTDEHMANVIEYLLLSCDCKVIVFAHNSHCLDYRATDHAARGEISVGQLCREKFDAYIVIQSEQSVVCSRIT